MGLHDGKGWALQASSQFSQAPVQNASIKTGNFYQLELDWRDLCGEANDIFASNVNNSWHHGDALPLEHATFSHVHLDQQSESNNLNLDWLGAPEIASGDAGGDMNVVPNFWESGPNSNSPSHVDDSSSVSASPDNGAGTLDLACMYTAAHRASRTRRQYVQDLHCTLCPRTFRRPSQLK